MTLVEITPSQALVTVINVFRVVENQQAEALDRLVAVNARIAREPGWISASVHRSFDGTRIANYAQWRAPADIVSALRHPDLVPLLGSLAEVGEGDWHLYDVVTAAA
jgi:hypothetical protein